MSEQPEALRLADWCDENSSGIYRPSAEAAAPAEAPMPECYVTSGGRDLFSEEQMRTYGDAREAAGYARGLKEADKLRGLLLWALYHHQGGSSNVGQPIRRALGIGQHDRLSDEQIECAKRAAPRGEVKP